MVTLHTAGLAFSSGVLAVLPKTRAFPKRDISKALGEGISQTTLRSIEFEQSSEIIFVTSCWAPGLCLIPSSNENPLLKWHDPFLFLRIIWINKDTLHSVGDGSTIVELE